MVGLEAELGEDGTAAFHGEVCVGCVCVCVCVYVRWVIE
jgi:hypothetical protein